MLPPANPIKGFHGGSDNKESACNAGDPGLIPERRKFQPTPVFLPGEFHRQRSLMGYSPWDRKESDTTEQLFKTTINTTKVSITVIFLIVVVLYVEGTICKLQ